MFILNVDLYCNWLVLMVNKFICNYYIIFFVEANIVMNLVFMFYIFIKNKLCINKIIINNSSDFCVF